MVDLYCESFTQIPNRVAIDDTFDAIHGGQQLRCFDTPHPRPIEIAASSR